jgi:hypothetical protein
LTVRLHVRTCNTKIADFKQTFSLFLPSDFRLDDGLKNAIAKGFPHGIYYKPIALLKVKSLLIC